MKMQPAPFFWLLAGVCLQLWACAADTSQPGKKTADAAAPSRDREKTWRGTMAKPSFAVTGTFDENGRLWTAAIRDRHLYVSHSSDRGASWNTPVKVNVRAENILGDGENRPKIVVRKGVVYVSYTQGLAKPMTGDIRFSRSMDGGMTFSPPVTVNDNHDVISHRFEALAVGDNGEVHLAWLDKRDLHAAQARNTPYRGAALYYAVSRAGGTSFGDGIEPRAAGHGWPGCGFGDGIEPRAAVQGSTGGGFADGIEARAAGQGWPGCGFADGTEARAMRQGCRDHGFAANVKLADHTCECCRVTMALDTDGVPVILWRHIYGKNVRDHALLRLDGKSTLARASFDNWEVDGCPHHGPALAIGSDGAYHIAWFTGGARPGLYYARSIDRGATFSAPRVFGDPARRASHPAVLSLGRHVYLAWKEFDGERSAVHAMHSADGGEWSVPRRLATTADASDHPQLLHDRGTPYLAWYSLKEGLRLIELTHD